MILASKWLHPSKRASGAEGQLPARRGTQDGLKHLHLSAMRLEASGLSAMRLEFHATPVTERPRNLVHRT